MQYKSTLKQNTIFTFCKNYTTTTTSRAGQIRNILQTQKKQLVNFGCKEMQTSGRKFVKSYGLADAVTVGILQLRTFLIFATLDADRSHAVPVALLCSRLLRHYLSPVLPLKNQDFCNSQDLKFSQDS